MADAPYLAVARFQKPHGLKGELIVFSLTDEPEDVFAVGRALTPLDAAGAADGAPVTIERSRPYHRRWLVKLDGVDDRTAAERLTGRTVGAPADALRAPNDDEMYAHEVVGAAVTVDGTRVGTARGLVSVPGGHLLVVDVEGREVLVPFRRPILVAVSRARREIAIDPPPGLLEL